MMAAYCFFDMRDVTNPAKLEEYRSRVLETVQKFGGRYVVVGGTCESVEGSWRPAFPVLIRFSSLKAAHLWYDSVEYNEIKSLRTSAATCEAVFMESEPSEFVSGD
jgi:uncharacterized protein (DUF1330 family)